MPFPAKGSALKFSSDVAIDDIVAHMASSIGERAARSTVDEALGVLMLPTAGRLSAQQAEVVFERLTALEGIVGLAARVTKQMIRLNMPPKR